MGNVHNDKRFYIDILKSEECHCEKAKKSGMAFCFLCYSSLPANMKGELWTRIGDGFETAYEEAMKWLGD